MIAVSALSLMAAEPFTYDAKGRRDPFQPLMGSERPTAGGLRDITAIDDVRLEGIASGKSGKLVAILNGEIVSEGDKAGVIEVKQISNKSVVLLVGGQKYTLVLPEEGAK